MCTVVSLIAGPGAGKSTFCASIFAKLKILGINCEMTGEYAKDKVWEKSFGVLENQIYIFAKQQHRLFRLKDQVDVIITDSPILLSIVYDKDKNQNFRNLILDEFKRYDNMVYEIIRPLGDYQRSGRMQDETGAVRVDKEVRQILSEENIRFQSVPREEESVDIIVNDIIKHLVSRGIIDQRDGII